MAYSPFTDPAYPLLPPPVNPMWSWEEDMYEKLAAIKIKGTPVEPEFKGVFNYQATLLARWQLTAEYWIDIPWPEDDLFLVRGRRYAFASRLIGEIEDVRVLTPSRNYASLVSSHVSWVSRTRKTLDFSDTANKVYGRLSHVELFQLLDDTNQTSILSHKRRVYNPSSKHRDIVEEFRGRLCPVETPESRKIGLTLHLAKDAIVDREGYIKAPFLIDGEIVYLSAKEEKERGLAGKLAWPDAIFSRATAQVPFIHHNDPNRVLMGTNHIKQALVPERPEPPIVRTGYELEDYGVNLLVAYAHLHGVTYEDAVVISETAAKKLTAATRKIVESRITRKEILIPDHYSLSYLDESGIVREGYFVREFDVLVAKARKLDSTEMASIANLPALEGYAISSTIVPRFVSGIVERVQVIDSPRRHVKKVILITIKQVSPAMVGDKLAGRYGNKGVIGAILPDDQMPRLPDGRPVEMVISPSSVISRMNLGQLLETQLSWILKEYVEGDEKALEIAREVLGGSLIEDPSGGLFVEAPHFGGLKVSSLIELQDRLDVPDKVNLYDPVLKRDIGPSVVGYQYILRLFHLARSKISGRASGPTDYMEMPTRSRSKRGGQKMGEMEGWALKAHGAANYYRELRAIRSDSYGGRTLAEFKILDGEPLHIKEFDGLTGTSVAYMMSALAASGLAVEIEEEDKDGN